MTFTQAALTTAAALALFIGGYTLSRLQAPPTPIPPTVFVEVPGDFKDVPVSMRSTMGTTFRWICDLYPAEDSARYRADCIYEDT